MSMSWRRSEYKMSQRRSIDLFLRNEISLAQYYFYKLFRGYDDDIMISACFS